MLKKNLLVFDIDGTLTDSVAIHQKAFVHALHEVGVENINTNFKTYLHHTDSFIAKTIYEKDRNECFSNLKIAQFEASLNRIVQQSAIKEILGAKHTIALLEQQTSFGVCYATGSLLLPAQYKLESIGIVYSKEQLVASNHIHERENIVQQAIQQAAIFYKTKKFNRVISIGDGLWDLHTANNLGIEFIGIGVSNKEVLFQNGMKNHFDDFKEVALNPKILIE